MLCTGSSCLNQAVEDGGHFHLQSCLSIFSPVGRAFREGILLIAQLPDLLFRTPWFVVPATVIGQLAPMLEFHVYVWYIY